jgi:alpha-L-fucosidase
MLPRSLVAGYAITSLLATGSGCSTAINALSRDDTAGAAASGSNRVCPLLPDGPPSTLPIPNREQLIYQRAELTASLHFGLGTFDGTEYGDPATDSATLFYPTNLDATQWVTTLKAAGFGQAMLVAKHSTGFCLWPSAYTDYSVRNSPWKNGQGDVVREFTDAMHDAQMRVGLHLSPWDENHPSSASDYQAYLRNLVTEVLTNYGSIDEIYFDGYRAPTSLDWQGMAQLAKQLQPNILVWMGPEIATNGADLRYIGNQSGRSSRTTSSVSDVPNGGPSNVWYPADAPVSDRGTNWFWHPGDTVKSLVELQNDYFNTVGMNATLILNVPPANTGQFDALDIHLLEDFGAWREALYKTNLLRGQPATADTTWAPSGFEAARALDDDLCTYWAAASGKTSARLQVTPNSPISVSLISLREPIELGERTTGYHIEIQQNGTWNESPIDVAGARIQGSAIGQRQLWQLNAITIEAIALVIESADAVPTIAEFSAY